MFWEDPLTLILVAMILGGLLVLPKICGDAEKTFLMKPTKNGESD